MADQITVKLGEDAPAGTDVGPDARGLAVPRGRRLARTLRAGKRGDHVPVAWLR